MSKETTAGYDKFAALNKFAARVKLTQGTDVLDLGSGEGRDARFLRGMWGLDVSCVDASISMVARTRRMGFSSYLMNFSQLEFEEGSFNGVWAYTALLHLPKVELLPTLTRIYSLLTPDGVLGLGMQEGDSEGWEENPDMPGTRLYFAYYEEQELKELLAEAGFNIVFFEKFEPGYNVYLNFICEKSVSSVVESSHVPSRGMTITLEKQRQGRAVELLLALTPKKMETLFLAARGLTSRQIAGELGMTVSTVEYHLRGVRKIMGVKSASRAVLDAANLGILDLGKLTKGFNLKSVKSLSQAEARVAEAMIQPGVPDSDSELARRLFLTVATVATHKASLLKKTGAHSGIQCSLILLAAKQSGLMPVWE